MLIVRKQRVKRVATCLFVSDRRNLNYRSFQSVSSLITDFTAFSAFVSATDWESKDLAETIRLELSNAKCTHVSRLFVVHDVRHRWSIYDCHLTHVCCMCRLLILRNQNHRLQNLLSIRLLVNVNDAPRYFEHIWAFAANYLTQLFLADGIFRSLFQMHTRRR